MNDKKPSIGDIVVLGIKDIRGLVEIVINKINLYIHSQAGAWERWKE